MKQDLAVGAAGGISRLDIENPHGGRLQDGDRLSNTHFQWIAIMFDALSASALRREIIILVLIKIVLLAFLKIAFFSVLVTNNYDYIPQKRHCANLLVTI